MLTRYAIEVSGGLDGLALTHVDRLPRIDRLAVAYDEPALDAFARTGTAREDGGAIVELRPGERGDLTHQRNLTRALREARPIYERLPDGESARVERLEATIERPVLLTSHGPRASDKRWRHDPPA